MTEPRYNPDPQAQAQEPQDPPQDATSGPPGGEDNPNVSLGPGQDVESRREGAGINEEGINLDPDAGQQQLQEATDRVEEKGFLGMVPDPTPNSRYSQEDMSDFRTPETDADLFNEARAASLGNPLEAVDKSSVHVAAEKNKEGSE